MNINAARLHVLLLMIGLGAIEPALAGYMDADCHALKLKDASGVPQDAKHSYKFLGTCNINAVVDSGTQVLQTVPAEAEGAWDGPSKTFKESFRVLGDVHIPDQSIDDGSSFFTSKSMNAGADISTGKVSSVFKCNDDPLLSNAAACLLSSHANQSGYGPFSNPALNQHRPLLKGKTTLAEATDFSKKHVASSTPPATPPPPAVKKEATKLGLTAPLTVTANPAGELNAPLGAARKGGGFVPNSEQRSAAPNPPAQVAARAMNVAPADAGGTRTQPSPPVDIVILGSKVDPNCQPPQPAAWISVTIKNGGSASSSQGMLHIKEVGGANLSGSKHLPPIAPGQTTPPVSTPLTTTHPYSKLAGAHQIAVYLNPKIEKGIVDSSKSAPPRMLTVTFPPGHCVVQRQAGPAAGGSASAKLPAVQVNPGSPSKPLGAPASR
jgi:hypothetical protein